MTPRGAVRVLLVEDNPADARLIAEYLSEVPGTPYFLESAGTLARGIALLGKSDVVLLDLSLPDATGLETARRMIAAAGECPVIILTGQVDDVLSTQAMGIGAQDYLAKSEISSSLIARTVRYAIERKRAEEGTRRLLAAEIAKSKSEEAARRSQLLADVGAALSASLNFGDTAQKLAGLLVPALGDASAIEIPDAKGVPMRIAHSESASSTGIAARGEANLLRSELVSEHVQRALQERRTVHLPDVPPRLGSSSFTFGQMPQASLGHAVLIVPMLVQDRAVGVLLLSRALVYGSEEVALTEEVGRRAALAAENARLYREAQVAVRARDEVLAVVAHDLRNPLSIFKLCVYSLRRVCFDDVRGVELLNKAERAYTRMIRLLDDLLDVSRIDAGTLSVQPEAIDLSSLLSDLVDLQRTLASEKNIILELEMAQPTLSARVDRERFNQMMGNLIGNAVKFTPASGRVRVRAESCEQTILIEVIDSGVGIPADTIDHIFDRFWQGGRQKELGVGLGLAIAKGIVEAHSGRISVSSEPGKGACFRVELPTSHV